ncbi:hypothetical protein B0H66DRAFT_534337 [Apodospora peruviana]|uniref:Dynamin N-terminal domain-containing protein n=1 Tax=Apodospora peruviana TaxID=516989 RepID=A0AAE0I017_9PEZI|nr:hypothetical protein B0H66DRAFT_534337 [Apodospora peruviana]
MAESAIVGPKPDLVDPNAEFASGMAAKISPHEFESTSSKRLLMPPLSMESSCVAGATGAGKTSLLNVLLEIPELLPASSTEAATATVCRIAWKHDDAPGKEFRAEIAFRSWDDVKEELHEIIQAVDERKKIREGEFNDEDERYELMEELTHTISRGVSTIRALWGLDEADIESMTHTAESILGSNEDIVRHLGTTMLVSSSDAEEFAADVKPHLDSTATTEGSTLWPLIREVNIYVESDILRHGITLVDLPGLSDNIESRAGVAEKYSQIPALTTIVTPAIRAVDERTGAKFHRDSFCVVISKIDDIDPDDFWKGSLQARKDPQLQKYNSGCKELQAQYNSIGKDLRTAAKKRDSADKKYNTAKEKQTANASALREAHIGEEKTKKVTKLNRTEEKTQRQSYALPPRAQRIQQTGGHPQKRQVEIEHQLSGLSSRKKHRCIWIRNENIKERIQSVFSRRQSKLSHAMSESNNYDGSVSIFPVCSTAFRNRLKSKMIFPGFPSKQYSGTPRLRQWLEETTLSMREQHLDALLHTLQRLLHGMDKWSNDQTRGLVKFARGDVESILENSYKMYSQKIKAELNRSAEEIKKLNPLGNRDEKLKSCSATSYKVASKWVYKFPERPEVFKNMSWATYQAILRRGGGPYTGSGFERIQYDFPETIAVPLLKLITEDWVKTFQFKIPLTQEPLAEKVKRAWDQYVREVEKLIQDTVPDMIAYFSDTRHTLQKIQTEMHDRMKAALTDARVIIWPDRNLFARKCSRIATSISTKDNRRWNKSIAKESHCFQENFESVEEFAFSIDKTALDEKTCLQQRMRNLTLMWAARWRVPQHDEESTANKNLDIPVEYIEMAVEDDDNGNVSEGDKSGSESESESESESDVSMGIDDD